MIKIYGADFCGYCDMAKKLAESKGLEYEYIKLNEGVTKDEFHELFPGVQTIPQIIVDGNWVGGYNEFAENVKNVI